MPRYEGTARESEEEHACRDSVLGQRLVVRLQPSPGGAEYGLPVGACDPSAQIRAKMRSRAWLKMEFLPRVVNADVAQTRHVGDLARDPLPRTLEKKTKVHARIAATSAT